VTTASTASDYSDGSATTYGGSPTDRYGHHSHDGYDDDDGDDYGDYGDDDDD
jgi:hypothetical protein